MSKIISLQLEMREKSEERGPREKKLPCEVCGGGDALAAPRGDTRCLESAVKLTNFMPAMQTPCVYVAGRSQTPMDPLAHIIYRASMPSWTNHSMLVWHSLCHFHTMSVYKCMSAIRGDGTVPDNR